MSSLEGLCSFCFLEVCLSHPDFNVFVRHTWNSYHTTGGMRGFYNKLQRLKTDLRKWNKSVFGNVFNAVAEAKAHVVQTETQYDSHTTAANHEAYHASKAILLQAQTRVCLFWKQKARVTWLQ